MEKLILTIVKVASSLRSSLYWNFNEQHKRSIYELLAVSASAGDIPPHIGLMKNSMLQNQEFVDICKKEPKT